MNEKDLTRALAAIESVIAKLAARAPALLDRDFRGGTAERDGYNRTDVRDGPGAALTAPVLAEPCWRSDMPNPTRDPVERFLSKCSEPDSNGCMLWRGGRDQDGYGMFWFDGRNVRAHRWAYETFVGPIPNGHQIDHVAARGCASTSCVNPAHLEAVTGKENLLRGRTFQAANAAKTHCHRGHPFDAANTYVHPTDGSRNCRECKRIWRRTHASAA